MASLNTAATSEITHEGAIASTQTPRRELERAVGACLLWEDTFYESGQSIADRIAALVPKVQTEHVANLAIHARNNLYLRHVPLLLVREMARTQTHLKAVRQTLSTVIQRADELTEFLAIYWKDGKQPIAAQAKKGLADAFTKFSEYDLAKYNRDNAITLKDVLFLVHAKPTTPEQATLWKRLVDDTLHTPDTWEVAISAAKGDAKATRKVWERLLEERKLGGLALLRNLRNMMKVGVDKTLLKTSIEQHAFARVLPFRFLAAKPHATGFESYVEDAMLRACKTLPKLQGDTCILVDVSGSMRHKLSATSDITRVDAAAGLAILARECAHDSVVAAFDTRTRQIPTHYRGFALQETIQNIVGGGTDIAQAVAYSRALKPTRTICITDEQSSTVIWVPWRVGYMLNVGSYKPSIAYGPWTSITGFSENTLRYIGETE